MENSLDAGATEIRVEIRDGGQRQLRVIDNGHGILAEEAPLAFQRHATSKLSTAEDLNHIATLGFRGEALFSISAVSHVTLTTRHHTAEFGTQLRLEGGELVSQSGAGAAVGTRDFRRTSLLQRAGSQEVPAPTCDRSRTDLYSRSALCAGLSRTPLQLC